MSVHLAIAEEIFFEPNLLWDTVWNGFIGDWAPAAASEPSNMGGLRARSPLHTAILLCLMSDRRAAAEDVAALNIDDPRGWPGDALDDAIAPLGSRLWLLRRRELTQNTAALAEFYAREALQTLIDQGVVAKFDVSVTPSLALGRLEILVEAYRSAADAAAKMKFWILWADHGVSNPLAA